MVFSLGDIDTISCAKVSPLLWKHLVADNAEKVQRCVVQGLQPNSGPHNIYHYAVKYSGSSSL